ADEIEPVPPLPAEITIDDFFNAALRVAKIESAEKLPKSKKLLKLQISLGAYGKRQILAGIAQHYEPEALVGRKIVVVANLKAARLMGEESQGMLLAASSGDNVILVDPGQDTEEGASVG